MTDMRQLTPDTQTGSRLYRYNLWANRCWGRAAHLLAKGLYGLSPYLGGNVQLHIIGLSRISEHFARTIVQPQYAAIPPGRRISLNGLLLLIFDGGVVGIWLSSVQAISALLGSFAWLAAIVILFALLILLMLLIVSGDVYFEKQDEGQQAMSQEAATQTLWIMLVLLVVFTLVDKSGDVWQHNNLYQSLALTLIVLAKLAYTANLAHLRWRDLAYTEEVQEEMPLVEEDWEWEEEEI